MADSMSEIIPNYQNANSDLDMLRNHGIPHTVASARIPEHPPDYKSITNKELEKHAELYKFSVPNENEKDNEPLSATAARRARLKHRLPPLIHNMSWHGKQTSTDSHDTVILENDAHAEMPKLLRQNRRILRQTSSTVLTHNDF